MINELPSDVLTGNKTSARRARWMVVDDDDGVRDLLAAVLETRGIADVACFRSASDALAAFTAAPEQFQFVITDLDMPGMNGIELCRRLRALAPQLKIMLATGNAAANADGARHCGFCGLIAKPFPTAELWRTVEACGVLNSPTLTATN
ncbi:MAG: response regulator [Verrucomicrobiota bacterium]